MKLIFESVKDGIDQGRVAFDDNLLAESAINTVFG